MTFSSASLSACEVDEGCGHRGWRRRFACGRYGRVLARRGGPNAGAAAAGALPKYSWAKKTWPASIGRGRGRRRLRHHIARDRPRLRQWNFRLRPNLGPDNKPHREGEACRPARSTAIRLRGRIGSRDFLPTNHSISQAPNLTRPESSKSWVYLMNMWTKYERPRDRRDLCANTAANRGRNSPAAALSPRRQTPI